MSSGTKSIKDFMKPLFTHFVSTKYIHTNITGKDFQLWLFQAVVIYGTWQICYSK